MKNVIEMDYVLKNDGVTGMAYTVNIDGMDIMIEENVPGENHDRLFQYYVNLLKANGTKVSTQKEHALRQIVDNMTNIEVQRIIDTIGARQLTRLMSYVEKFTRLTVPEKEKADALEEVLEAAGEDAMQERKNINGNVFLYEKGTLNIDHYCKKLYDIGEKTKGNTWTIYIDEEGELVIY